MADLRQTPEYVKYMEILGWSVSRYQVLGSSFQVFLRKIPLLGNIAKLQRPQKINFKQISQLIQKHNISAFYLEPSLATHSHNLLPATYYLSKTSFLPSKTIHIDLKKSEKELLKEMKPKTRYNIGLAKKRGVVIRESQDIEAFTALWKSAAIKRFALPQNKEIKALWQAFEGKTHLILAYKNDVLLAGVLTAKSLDTSFYMYAASNQEGKNMFAPTLVAWEAIKLAKYKGSKVFDFEGIYDERYPSTKSWRGFTKFKEGFGGKVVEFPAAFAYHKNFILKLLNI